MNIFKFKNIFSSLISKKKTLDLLKIIKSLYNKKIINEEIILNIIKVLVIVLHIDKKAYDNYYKLLVFLNENEKASNKIFKKLKLIDLRLQFNLPIKIVDKIIICINEYIIKIKDNEYFKYLNIFNEVLTSIIYMNVSIEYKINLFLYLIKNSFNKKKINIIYDVKDIKSIINKFTN